MCGTKNTTLLQNIHCCFHLSDCQICVYQGCYWFVHTQVFGGIATIYYLSWYSKTLIMVVIIKVLVTWLVFVKLRLNPSLLAKKLLGKWFLLVRFSYESLAFDQPSIILLPIMNTVLCLFILNHWICFDLSIIVFDCQLMWKGIITPNHFIIIQLLNSLSELEVGGWRFEDTIKNAVETSLFKIFLK